LRRKNWRNIEAALSETIFSSHYCWKQENGLDFHGKQWLWRTNACRSYQKLCDAYFTK